MLQIQCEIMDLYQKLSFQVILLSVFNRCTQTFAWYHRTAKFERDFSFEYCIFIPHYQSGLLAILYNIRYYD